MSFALLALVVLVLVGLWVWRSRRSAASSRTVAKPVSPPPETDAPLIQDGQFTVYRPSTAIPEKWHPLLAFAHRASAVEEGEELPDDPAAEVERQARALLGGALGDYASASEDSSQALPLAGEITFVPDVEGIEFDPPERRFKWVRPIQVEQFQFRAPAELDGRTARGRMAVYFGAVLIADINLALKIDSSGPAEEKPTQPSTSRPYRKIFASYSHEDTEIVEQFGDYARTLGDEFLRDVTTLRSGEVWNERLMELIREADVFQLFWSWNSIDSRYVRQEYEFALALARPHFIRPTYWQDPFPRRPEKNLPPSELRRLHFHRLPDSLEVSAREHEDPAQVQGTLNEREAKRSTPASSSPIPVPEPARKSTRGRRLGKPMMAVAALLLMAIVVPALWFTASEEQSRVESPSNAPPPDTGQGGPLEPSPPTWLPDRRSTQVTLRYLGDDSGCRMDLYFALGMIARPFSGGELVVEVAPGRYPVLVEGQIVCPSVGSCLVNGVGEVEIYEGGVYDVVWRPGPSSGYCEVELVDAVLQ